MDSYKKIWSRVIECGSIYAAIQAGSSFVEWWHGLLEGSFMYSLKSLWSLANWKTSLTLQLWWHSSKKLVQKLNISNTDTNSIHFISIQFILHQITITITSRRFILWSNDPTVTKCWWLWEEKTPFNKKKPMAESGWGRGSHLRWPMGMIGGGQNKRHAVEESQRLITCNDWVQSGV